MQATIRTIEYVLPENSVSSEQLSAMFPQWSVAEIAKKTGISARHIASLDECASDLAVAAATKIFQDHQFCAENIDYILFCTQSPDYVLPTTACLVQTRLGLSNTVGALDYNLGCSGFVYGLGLAQGLILSGQAKTILLLTADTYSKYLAPNDRACRTIFGDGAAATLLTADENEGSIAPSFLYGTDGTGAHDLIVPNSGSRRSARTSASFPEDLQAGGNDPLQMRGASIFSFALRIIPGCVHALLHKANLSLSEINLFVFHQANAYLLEELRKVTGIPAEKFHITLSHCGNTVSSSIPIALKHALLEGKLKNGDKIMLIGFGVGYSWAGAILQWRS